MKGSGCYSENPVLFAVTWLSGAASATHMNSKNTNAPLTATVPWLVGRVCTVGLCACVKVDRGSG